MNAIKGAPETVSPLTTFTIGLMGGLAMGLSAWLQGNGRSYGFRCPYRSSKRFWKLHYGTGYHRNGCPLCYGLSDDNAEMKF